MSPHLTAGLALALVLTTLGTPSTMAASDRGTLSCGDTITSDTRLTVDLVNCTGTGLVIGVDAVTLDLNGHRIEGDAAGDDAGIDIEGHRGIRIENGSVHGFANGVFVLAGRDIAIRGLRTAGAAHGGVFVDGGSRVAVTHSAVRRSGAGIIVSRSNRVLVAGNRISGSASGGIPVFDSQQVEITGNTVSRCRTDMGIGLVAGSSHNSVTGNRVSHNGAGIVMADGASHNLIAGNLAHRNEGGVIVDVGTHDNLVVGNVIEGSAFEGIAVVGSDRNLIARNLVARSGSIDPAGGIVVIPLPDDLSETSDGNIVVRNSAIRNFGDGIQIGEGQSRNRLRGNGADHNSRLGISAAPGTVDGGGNRAAHNGDPRQCVGVTCVPEWHLRPAPRGRGETRRVSRRPIPIYSVSPTGTGSPRSNCSRSAAVARFSS